jgi:F-type H+-transporting ATPase subunit alpha
LKQKQYEPLSVEAQILSIFAGINGYVDDLPIEQVRSFEQELIKFFDEGGADLKKDLASKKSLDKELTEKIKKALDGFKREFIKKQSI